MNGSLSVYTVSAFHDKGTHLEGVIFSIHVSSSCTITVRHMLPLPPVTVALKFRVRRVIFSIQCGCSWRRSCGKPDKRGTQHEKLSPVVRTHLPRFPHSSSTAETANYSKTRDNGQERQMQWGWSADLTGGRLQKRIKGCPTLGWILSEERIQFTICCSLPKISLFARHMVKHIFIIDIIKIFILVLL